MNEEELPAYLRNRCMCGEWSAYGSTGRCVLCVSADELERQAAEIERLNEKAAKQGAELTRCDNEISRLQQRVRELEGEEARHIHTFDELGICACGATPSMPFDPTV